MLHHFIPYNTQITSVISDLFQIYLFYYEGGVKTFIQKKKKNSDHVSQKAFTKTNNHILTIS